MHIFFPVNGTIMFSYLSVHVYKDIKHLIHCLKAVQNICCQTVATLQMKVTSISQGYLIGIKAIISVTSGAE